MIRRELRALKAEREKSTMQVFVVGIRDVAGSQVADSKIIHGRVVFHSMNWEGEASSHGMTLKSRCREAPVSRSFQPKYIYPC